MKQRGTTLQDYNLIDIYKTWKSLSFCEIWNDPTSPLFFIRPPHKQALQDMEFYDKLLDGFQDLPKVNNPVNKAKV